MKAIEAAKTDYVEYVEGEKYAVSNAAISPAHEHFKDAGKKLGDDDVIVDIDNLPIDIIKKMISYFGINTEIRWTDRGVHMWFKKPKGYKHKGEGICALGFQVEWKTSKTTKSITVKLNGLLRPVENEGVREELPDFLTWIKNAEDLQGLQDGDGRNKKLHSHKFRVIHFTDSKKILRFINENMFAEPLEDKEFDNVIRDERIKPDKNNEYEVAMQIKKKLKVVKFSDRLYHYDGKCYCDDNFKYAVASEIKGQRMNYIKEILGQIDIHTEPIEEPLKGWTIKFKNGCLRDGRWINIDYQDFTPYYIDIPYNPDAEPVPTVDQFLEDLTEGDKEYRDFILETIAHCLITNIYVKKNKNFQRVTFFIGGGGNGKGTLLLVIRTLLGTRNVSSISLDRIIDERYICSLPGKLANCGDDIEDKAIDSEKMKMLKNLCAYDVIPFRELYKKSKDEAPIASQIFSTNHLLKSFEKDDSWKRRAVWCPVFGKPKAEDPHFQEKLTSPEALEYLLRLVMEAYFRLYEKRKFTESKKVMDYTEFYHRENNSCIEWLESREEMEKWIIEKQPRELHGEYEKWAEENGLNVQSQKVLKRTIEEKLGLYIHNTTRGKQSVRIWAKK